MAIMGLRDTADFVADQRPKNWREGILLRYPNGKMPLLALTSLMKKKSTDDPQFYWWTKEFPTQRLAITTAINNTDATTALQFSAGGASQIRTDHVLLIEGTGELVRVTADPSTDTAATVLRGFAGTTKAALNPATAGTNPNVLVVGTARMEGSMPATAISYNPAKFTNYTQIFRNSLSGTRTAMKTRLRTGDQVRESKRECLELHGVEIERALWWGQPSEDLTGSEPRRTTAGVLSFIPAANITAWGSTDKKWSTLEALLKEIFKYGSSEKVTFAGDNALLNLQRVVRNAKGVTLELVQGQKEFGMNVSRLMSPFGDLVLKTHPLFNILTGGTTGGTPYYGMDSSIVILDMEEIIYRPFEGADMVYEKQLAANGLDGMLSGYLTECGLEMHHPGNHFWIKEFATFVAE